MRPIVVPYSTRFHGPGMEEGPDALLATLDSDAVPTRVELPLDAPPHEALAAGLPRIADAVAASTGRPALALLGECTLAPGVVAGLERAHPDLAVLWLDAHGDLNTPATSPSGFLGGMPFAMLVGWTGRELTAPAGLQPVDEARCALVGARDLDPGERDALDASRIVEAASVAEALAKLPRDAPLYVHVDGDVLDPGEAPAVDFPAPGGWTPGRLRRELEEVWATGRVVGVGVCCGNPRRDPDGTSTPTLRAALAGLGPLA